MPDNLRAVATTDDDEVTPDTDRDMTSRALLVLTVDVGNLSETVERIKVQVHALSKRHDLN